MLQTTLRIAVLSATLVAPLALRAVSWKTEEPKPIDPSMADAGKCFSCTSSRRTTRSAPRGTGSVRCSTPDRASPATGRGGREGAVPETPTSIRFSREVICGIVTPRSESSGLIHAAADGRGFPRDPRGSDGSSSEQGHSRHRPEDSALFVVRLIQRNPIAKSSPTSARQQAQARDGRRGLRRTFRWAAPRSSSGNRLGRFGWKGQIASLEDFVQAACANELGLGNPSSVQAGSAARPPGSRHRPHPATVPADHGLRVLAAAPVERTGLHLVARPSPGAGGTSRASDAPHATSPTSECRGIYSDLPPHEMGKQAHRRRLGPTRRCRPRSTSPRPWHRPKANGARRPSGAWPTRPPTCTTAGRRRSKQPSWGTPARELLPAADTRSR